MTLTMPRSRAAAYSSATGKTSAVAEVMWLAKTMRVRGPAAAIMRGTTSSGTNGKGSATRR